MKRTIRTGPKRRRWRRRDWSGVGGYGQLRRWGSTDINFSAERDAHQLTRGRPRRTRGAVRLLIAEQTEGEQG